VYLHGLGGDCKAWEFMRQTTLDCGYNFLALDLPGHGESYRPGLDFNSSDYVEAVSLVITKYCKVKPILVGHCLGGLVALDYAIWKQKELRGIILINSGYRMASISKFSKLIKPVLTFVPKFHITGHINHDIFIGTVDISLRRFVSDVLHVGLRSYLTMFVAISDYNHRNDLHSIYIPSVIIGGLFDTIYPLANQKYLAKYMKNAKLIKIDSNHISVLNSREKLQNILKENLINFGRI